MEIDIKDLNDDVREIKISIYLKPSRKRRDKGVRNGKCRTLTKKEINELIRKKEN